eukprot:c25714_g1_i1.p1 GENE.c25714_g1_i1~~c25714_g1_i1.p1  ORF type:complete len:106 (+),score=5.35 c25714_g1_i1:55-372(+)
MTSSEFRNITKWRTLCCEAFLNGSQQLKNKDCTGLIMSDSTEEAMKNYINYLRLENSVLHRKDIDEEISPDTLNHVPGSICQKHEDKNCKLKTDHISQSFHIQSN